MERGFILETGFAEAGPDLLMILMDYRASLSARDQERNLAMLQKAASALAVFADGSTKRILFLPCVKQR